MKNRYFLNVIIGSLSAIATIIIYNSITDKKDIDTDSSKVVASKTNLKETLVNGDSNNVHYASLPSYMESENIDFTIAAEKSIHAVVHITSKSIQRGYYNNPVYEFFFGQQYYEQPVIGYGSGVIITDDGYIVTNNHVVENADELQVVLNDKRQFSAEIVGRDPSTDLALLKIDGENLPFINMGNSDELKVGEWVLAVGNPFNFTSTVTAGIVSAKSRNINILDNSRFPIESFIQTDAAVNKGNSGGALVNLRGQLVGINSAIVSPTGAYSGYSFAIPVTIAKKVVSDILKYGEVQRAILGVSISDVTADIAEEEGLDKIEGVYVNKTQSPGAASEAGIRTGDVVLEINGVKVNSTAELSEQVGRYRPGEEINILVKRNNKKKQFSVVLRNMHGNKEIFTTDDLLSALGAKFQPVDESQKRKLGIEHGVQIVDVEDGKFKDAGIKEGFVIMYIDDKPVEDIDDIKQMLLSNSKSSLEIGGKYLGGGRFIYVYRLDLE